MTWDAVDIGFFTLGCVATLVLLLVAASLLRSTMSGPIPPTYDPTDDDETPYYFAPEQRFAMLRIAGQLYIQLPHVYHLAQTLEEFDLEPYYNTSSTLLTYLDDLDCDGFTVGDLYDVASLCGQTQTLLSHLADADGASSELVVACAEANARLVEMSERFVVVEGVEDVG